MPSYDTSNLDFVLDTPLGSSELIVASFTAQEGISQLYSLSLELFSENDSIDFSSLVGEPVTLKVRAGGPQGLGLRQAALSTQTAAAAREDVRYFSGIISRFSQTRRTGHFARYRAEVVPWLWLLTQTTNCRIFQNMTAVEIAEQIFGERGYSGKYRLELQGSYETREYCVQYRETDYSFVSRLLEDEGIFFYFVHEEDNHILVLADDPSAHEPCEPGSSVEYLQVGGRSEHEGTVEEFIVEEEIRPGAYALNDYNFTAPSSSLDVSTIASDEKWEVYDYPGNYQQRSAGESLVSIRMQAEVCQRRKIGGHGNCRQFVPGYRFELRNHEREEYNAEYVLVSTLHGGNQESQILSETPGAGASYENQFECIPLSVPFRPLRMTPRPEILGCQTAVVVGPAGEELWLDKYGRVKVKFHWDRSGQRDDTSSCWIRVSQNWAGKNWGISFHPRIGQEVIVSFLEGNPDRPIITGRVYNEEQMPPYELPASGTRSAIKTRSSKGGDPSNFNEIRFEDKKGSEEVYIHAEKSYTQVTENNSSESVGNNQSLSVGNDQTEDVGNNKTDTVGKDLSVTVGRDKKLSIGTDHKEDIGASMVLTVGSSREMNVGSDLKETIGGEMSVSVGSNLTEDVGGSKKVSVGKDLQGSISGDASGSVSGNLQLVVGKKAVITATDELAIRVGGASLLMKKSGDILISGTKISLKGSGDVTIRGSSILGN
ncbi:MAG: type VI secretion system tip protein VgrG [Planctomycetes bacterium]|nr:type VI secretion system tip protein VgrG [Planctomycetota bacterium]